MPPCGLTCGAGTISAVSSATAQKTRASFQHEPSSKASSQSAIKSLPKPALREPVQTEPVLSVNPNAVTGGALSYEAPSSRSQKIQEDIRVLEEEIEKLDRENAAFEGKNFTTKKTITHNAPFRYTVSLEESEGDFESDEGGEEGRFPHSKPPAILWSTANE